MGNQFDVALQPFSLFIEASDTGYGGHTVEHGMHTAHGCCEEHEAKLSSIWRELMAVAMVMEFVAMKLAETSYNMCTTF